MSSTKARNSKVEPLKDVYDIHRLSKISEAVDKFLREYVSQRDARNREVLHMDLDAIEAHPQWVAHKSAIELLRENCGDEFRLYFWW